MTRARGQDTNAACPRLLVGGASSGVGKTTFTVGLCRALMRRGLGVSVFKCGPDYLDPTYHRIASGHPVHNLDSWLMRPEALEATFVRHAGDISLIEGVMGLFDGASPTELVGSSAEIAQLLRAPIVLVCDASGMARSVAALAHGFETFEPGVSLAALICNRVGSKGHLELLRRACTRTPVLGGLPKNAAPSFPERHLGLQSARELELEPSIEAWADQVEENCDVPALIDLARSALPLASPPAPSRAARRRCRIAVAEDDAFHFYYEANLHLLEQAGAELVRFSPLHDAALGDIANPIDGVYIGGGYPELHAAKLAANTSMLCSLRQLAASGTPFYAECGGLMYLSTAIMGRDGSRHAMLGLIDGTASMTDRLQALGYVDVQTQIDTPLGPAGTRFRGHQFRYSRFDSALTPTAYTLVAARNGLASPEGYVAGNVLASYVHAHWASNPQLAEAFVARCEQTCPRTEPPWASGSPPSSPPRSEP
jgi:cobyrinic acid a,c-diamide synthase